MVLVNKRESKRGNAILIIITLSLHRILKQVFASSIVNEKLEGTDRMRQIILKHMECIFLPNRQVHGFRSCY